MTEKNTAGAKELIFALLWAAALLAGYDAADTAARLYAGASGGAPAGWNMILTIGAILLGCVLVYTAMTHYAAVFTYSAYKGSVRLTRRIGRREKTVEIKNREIVSFSKKKPANAPKPAYKMRKTVFSDKNAYYIVYKSGGALRTAVFEPSAEMAEEISSRVKEG